MQIDKKDIVSIYEDRGTLLEVLKYLVGNIEDMSEIGRGRLDDYDTAKLLQLCSAAKKAIRKAERIIT